jgi:hypothetical protein
MVYLLSLECIATSNTDTKRGADAMLGNGPYGLF